MAIAVDLTTFVMPMIVGAIVASHGLSAAQAGFVATAQLVTCAVLSMAIAPKVRVLPPRATLLSGLGLVCIGNFAPIVFTSLPSLVIARLAVGVGEALVNVMVAVLAARLVDPDRAFASISFGIIAGVLIVYLLTPLMVPFAGKDAIFWALTGLPILAVPFAFWTPAGSCASEDQAPLAPHSPFKITPPIIALLAGIVGFGVAGNAIFVFVERIGENVGLSFSDMARLLSLVSVVTLLGPAIAHVVGTRFGRVPPLAVGYAAVAVAGLMIGFSHSPIQLGAGLIVQSIAILLVTPFHMGLLAALDSEGRLVSFSRGILGLGAAITPGVASIALLLGGGFGMLAILSAVICILSFASIFTAAISADRRKTGVQLTPTVTTANFINPLDMP
jgi:MFS family permease